MSSVTFSIIRTTAIPKIAYQLGKRSTLHQHSKLEGPLEIPRRTIRIAVLVLFPENAEDPKQHALTWLRSKWGIPCNRASSYLAKPNLRFTNDAEPFLERFIRAIR